MELDPRVQLSDLTDYQFQASLAPRFDPYSASTLQNHQGLQNGSQYAGSESTLYRPSQPHGSAGLSRSSTNGLVGLAGMYEAASVSSLPTPPSEASRHQTAYKSNHADKGEVKDPNTFVAPHLLAPMKPNPPNLEYWRTRLFNVDEPIVMSADEYLTYFPHVDNVYSHRSTQRYKRKPFVSHYWDCRLKGRPTGTPMNKKKVDENGQEKEPKKRKRKARERDLCDVKIKVTEFFGEEDLDALRKLDIGPEVNANGNEASDLTFVLDSSLSSRSIGHMPGNIGTSTFGILEPSQNYPPGHPGAGGKKWYMIQRVNGTDKIGGNAGNDEDLDHKHTLEESDQIKKNSVQRWLLAREKEKKKAKPDSSQSVDIHSDDDHGSGGMSLTASSVPKFQATGAARKTANSHVACASNDLTFFGCPHCPFAQRVWITLEFIGIPYRYVEVTERDWFLPPTAPPGTTPKCLLSELNDINPEGRIPCLKHNNFAVWESQVMMEYLEDLAMGPSLFVNAVGNAQLKAHSRLWVDFINRRIIPVFYALLLLPHSDTGDEPRTITNLADRNAHAHPNSRYNDETYPMASSFLPRSSQCDLSSLPPGTATRSKTTQSIRAQNLITNLHSTITTLVNASHQTGPFFLGPTLTYVDIAFAPWIIRLSRVLSHYRGFPRPEVGTRWYTWCQALENHEIIQRTLSEEQNYRDVYGGVAGQWKFDNCGRMNLSDAREQNTGFPEMEYVQKMVDAADIWGQMATGGV